MPCRSPWFAPWIRCRCWFRSVAVLCREWCFRLHTAMCGTLSLYSWQPLKFARCTIGCVRWRQCPSFPLHSCRRRSWRNPWRDNFYRCFWRFRFLLRHPYLPHSWFSGRGYVPLRISVRWHWHRCPTRVASSRSRGSCLPKPFWSVSLLGWRFLRHSPLRRFGLCFYFHPWSRSAPRHVPPGWCLHCSPLFFRCLYGLFRRSGRVCSLGNGFSRILCF